MNSTRLLTIVLLSAACAPGPQPGDDQSANVETVRRQHEQIWSQGRTELIPEIYAPDYVGHFPSGPQRGHEGIRRAIEEIRAAFPDWTEEIVDTIAANDRVVTRYVSRGTHQAEFLGRPATGNTVEIAEASIYRMVDGKIAEQWVFPDILSMQRQLGPPTGAAPE